MSQPVPLTPEDTIFFDRVRRVLEKRIGTEMKITIEELARMCDFPSKRACEDFVQKHWSMFPFVLVNLNGLFQPTEAAQINHYISANRSRIRNIAVRNRSTARQALAHGWKREGKRFLDQPRQQDLFA